MISSGSTLARVAAPQRGRQIVWVLGKKLERPLVGPDWPALTAFSIVSLFHQKRRGVKVVMMIDWNSDRLGLGRAPPSKLVSDYSGFSSDRPPWPAGTDGLRETKQLRSTTTVPGLLYANA
jgi:hypothetical protein